MTFVFLRGQLAFMKSKGFDVHVMSAPGPEMDAFAREEGVTAHPVAMARQITPLKDIRSVATMIGVFRSVRPDIVHASTPKGGLLGTIAARLARVPVVIYHVRGLPYTAASGIQKVLLRATERISCALAHEVLCVSNSVRAELLGDGLSAREKTFVLAQGSSNGVDGETRFNPEQFSADKKLERRGLMGIPAAAPVIGFVGRLVGDKGIGDLAAAFEIVSRSHPGTHLLLVGGWEERDAVPIETRRALENNTRVRFAGEQRDTAAYYSIMDVLVLPTLREGFPNVPLEAAAMGIPVVATSVTGCVDAVEHGRTGMLVPARNPEALASAIADYLDSPELRQSHGAAGRRRVLDSFRPRDIWEALLAKYTIALAR